MLAVNFFFFKYITTCIICHTGIMKLSKGLCADVGIKYSGPFIHTEQSCIASVC